MKNKLLYIILLMAGLFQACAPEVDDLFDKPAQQRINEEIKACRDLLVSSEQGWRLEYFPSATQAYGGYNMILKFTEKEVTAAGETASSPSYTETSLYSMGSDMGPTLNFDTYNSIIHYFADPDKQEGAGLGKGYEGDYEFIIMGHSDNEIILKGKKTKNVMRMIRMEESAESYLTAVQKIRDDYNSLFGVEGASGTINGQSVSLSFPSDRKLSAQIGTEELQSAAYLFTSTGIRFYSPLLIGGKEVDSFGWSFTDQAFEYEGQTIPFRYDPNMEDYTQYLGKYTMKYNGYYGASSLEIELTIGAYKQNYIIKGMLPIDVIMTYAEPVVDGVKTPRMELLNQQLLDGSGNYLSVWNAESGRLTWGGTDFRYGMYGERDADNPNLYRFVDDGRREEATTGMILWGQPGEYRAYGESRFAHITLLKHD